MIEFQPSAVVGLSLFFIVGTFVAWLVCYIGARLDKHAGEIPTVPTRLTFAIFLVTMLVFAPAVYASFPVLDPCYGLDWTNPFYWLYGCFY